MLRLPEGMRDRLKKHAEKQNRTMNAEIVARLEKTVDLGEVISNNPYAHIIKELGLLERLNALSNGVLLMHKVIEGKLEADEKETIKINEEIQNTLRLAKSAIAEARKVFTPELLSELDSSGKKVMDSIDAIRDAATQANQRWKDSKSVNP